MMKKVLLPAVVLILFFSSFIYAQIPVKLGVRAGLNLANLSYDPDVATTLPGASKSGRTVFLVGGVFQLSFVGPLALEIEPTYIQKGAKIEASNVAINVDGQFYQVDKLAVTEKLTYLEIPILLRVYLPVPGIKPYAEAGPTVGINLSSTLSSDVTVGSQSNSDDTDNKDNISSTEFGLAFGAGLEYGVAPFTSLFFDIRYSLGLSNIEKSQTTQPGESSSSTKTNGIQFSLGLLFGL